MATIGWLAAAMLLASVGSGLAQSDKVHQTVERAKVDLAACFKHSAEQLDDRISDARSVATALLATCVPEQRALDREARAVTGMTAPPSPALRQRMRDTLIDQATAIVLSVRRQKAP